jgi:glycosyltransferase involved in cell wall biosynthesis
VVTEAMALGLLVATTRTGCALDLIVDGENGILADFDNPVSLASRIGECLGALDSIGRRSRQSVRHLTWDYVAKRTIEAYVRTLEEPGAPGAVSSGDC